MNTPRRHPIFATIPLAIGSFAILLAGCGAGSSTTGILHTGRTGDLTYAPAPRGDSNAEIEAACARPVDSPAGAAVFFRRPFLQQMTDHSVQIDWMSSTALTSATITRPDGSLVAVVPASEDASTPDLSGASARLADVQGLEPATIYCYELRAGDVLEARSGFRTAPAASTGAPVRFAAVGDTGARTSDQEAVLGQMQTVPIDFVVNTGDLAYESGAAMEIQDAFFEPYANMMQRFPTFPASGNHEYGSSDALPFRQAFHLPENGGPEGVERWYSFDWGDVHFVALDTERTGPVQAAWLDANLTANRLPWTIVFGHRPPYSSGEHGNDISFREQFGPVLEKHHVPLVLSGHDHDYERSTPQNGVVYVVTGGGGRGVRSVGTSAFTAFSDAVAHFVYVTVVGDELTLYAIDGSGADIDSVRIRR